MLYSVRQKNPRFSSIAVTGFVSRLAFSERGQLFSPLSALRYREQPRPPLRVGKVETTRNCATGKMLLLRNFAHIAKIIERRIDLHRSFDVTDAVG